MPSGKKKVGTKNPSLSSVLTRNALMRMAGPVYFERGEGYFNSRLVGGLVELDGRITAKVSGTRTYKVGLWVERGGLDHSCTCPLGDDGEFCKHCVATGLEWLDQHKDRSGKGGKSKKASVVFKDVRDYLLAQDKQTLVETILEQARTDDRLRQSLLAKTARASSKGLDLDALRAAIDYALEFDGYVDYRSMRDYASGIEEAIVSIENLLKEGQAAETMDISEYALSAVEGAINHVDDSDGRMEDILCRLQEIHLRACKKARPDPEELAKRLFHWELNSDYEVFHGAAETYKNLLGKKGLAVYLELARREWDRLPALGPGSNDRESSNTKRFRVTSMMETLARQSGDIEELVSVNSRNLSSPYRFFQIAEVYKKARKHEKALEWAERGVKSFPKRPDARLMEFLAGEYHRAKRHEDAIKQIWAIFASSPGLEHYRLLKSHADKMGQWPLWRGKAIALIRERFEKQKAGRANGWFKPENSLLVEIHLWEKDIEAAWQVAQNTGCGKTLWLELAGKRERDFPEDALEVYLRMVEPTVEQKNDPAYKEAVGYMKKISALMDGLGRKDEFLRYIDSIRIAHKRKRNFVRLLERAKLS